MDIGIPFFTPFRVNPQQFGTNESRSQGLFTLYDTTCFRLKFHEGASFPAVIINPHHVYKTKQLTRTDIAHKKTASNQVVLKVG